MEKISLAQLNSALTLTAQSLQKSLSSEDGMYLLALLNQTAKRYPNQDLAGTGALSEYIKDFEQLSLKYSLREVDDAIAALRIDPEQDFFPTPNEVAAKIQQKRLRKVPSHMYARG